SCGRQYQVLNRIRFLPLVMLLLSLMACSDVRNDPDFEIGLGFYGGMSSDGFVTILAAYNTWNMQATEKDSLNNIKIGSLVYFEYRKTGDKQLSLVHIKDHGFPDQFELEKIV